jgi:hypothetical protein
MLAPRQTPSTLPRPRSDCVEFDVHTSSPHQMPSQDAAMPPSDSGPHAFGGTHQSGGLLATSFERLHPFNGLSTHPHGRLFSSSGIFSCVFAISMFDVLAHSLIFGSVQHLHASCIYVLVQFCVLPPPPPPSPTVFPS